MRCFVATFLEADSARLLRGAYAAWAKSGGLSRRRRDVPVENYHVTLKFLGEIERAAAADAVAAVAELSGTALETAVTGFNGFPRAGAARVVVAELGTQDELARWWAALDARLGTEDRRFRPHVTLGRLHGPPVRLDPQPHLQPPLTPLAIALGPPRLYRSDTGPGGVRYRPVSRSDLDGDGDGRVNDRP